MNDFSHADGSIMTKLNPSHPGLSVLDSLDEVGWTVTEFADRLGIPEAEVSDLLNSASAASPPLWPSPSNA